MLRGRWLGPGAAVGGGVLGIGVALAALVIGPIATPAPAMEASAPDTAVSQADESVVGVGESTIPAPSALPAATLAPAVVASGASANATATPSFQRVPKPAIPGGPRRIGIQAGHWEAEKAPPELGRILTETGTSWNGVNERNINWDIAHRIKAILEAQGYIVDVLPTTVPPGYLADAFVSLHGDGDGTGENSGYKMAFSTRRTPYESALLEAIKKEYGQATGLRYDSARVSRNMTGYFAHAWTRVRYSTSPFTPSVILEMGYVSNDHDRTLMLTKGDVIANAVSTGIVSFLDAHPRETLFGKDLLVAPFRFRIP